MLATDQADQATTPKRPTGRPSKYTEELAEFICNEISDGKGLKEICANPDMPCRQTVLRWLGTHDQFATQYAQAREAQADVMDEMILDIARRCTSETANADRIRLMALQWRAARLNQRRYGDKQLVEATGSVTLNVVTGVPRQAISATVEPAGDVIEGEIVGQALGYEPSSGDDSQSDQ